MDCVCYTSWGYTSVGLALLQYLAGLQSSSHVKSRALAGSSSLQTSGQEEGWHTSSSVWCEGQDEEPKSG